MQMMARRPRFVGLTLLTGLLLVCTVRPARAQVIVPGAIQAAPKPAAERQKRNRLFVSDRDLSPRLATGQQLLKDGETAQGLTLLQSILDHAEDFAVETDVDNGRFPGGLKAAADASLAKLTSQQREVYELQFGATARDLLTQATASGSIADLENVARRFLHTAAGQEATQLLATYYLDHSQPFAAVLHFERLRQLPDAAKRLEPLLSLKTAVCWRLARADDNAIKTLVELKQFARRPQIALAGQQVPLFDNEQDALKWLDTVMGGTPPQPSLVASDWRLFGGHPTRNAGTTPASAVLVPAWNQSIFADPEIATTAALDAIEGEFDSLQADYANSNVITLPAGSPIVAGDRVIFRTLRNLRAVDRQSGKLLWQSAIASPQLDSLLEDLARPGAENRDYSDRPISWLLGNHAWRDLTAGTLSADDRSVYAITADDIFGGHPYAMSARADAESLDIDNKLLSIDLASGRALWEIGGPRGEFELPLAGTYFLGPPTPLDGKLYCIAETSGEIRLLVLAADTGNMLWSQSLVHPENSLLQYPLRRLAGLSPASLDGVMVCATATGAIVAVDTSRRELLWAYRYPHNVRTVLSDARIPAFAQAVQTQFYEGSDTENRWIDSIPIIAEGRVIAAPRDSDELHCVDLRSGELRWKIPRGEGLYVAAVEDGRVIVVGRGNVRAWKLADGSPAWNEPSVISQPSGRGYRSGDLYHLPLSTGDVATIDLHSGRILAQSRPHGDLPLLGNLVAADGAVIGQTAKGVFGCESLSKLLKQVEADLKQDPNDHAALVLRGELALHAGNVDQGLKDLNAAVAGSDDAQARHTLSRALLEGLRVDFETYRHAASEMQAIFQDHSSRIAFARLFGTGLERSGEPVAAVEQYLQLREEPLAGLAPDERDGSLVVRGDRSARLRIADIYARSTQEQQAAIDRLCESLVADNPDAVKQQQLLAAIESIPAGDRVLRDRLAAATAEEIKSQLLVHEFQLLQLRRSRDPEIAAFATARLASLLIESGRVSDAKPLLQELTTKWGDATCLDGKTGKELVEQWQADVNIAQQLAGPALWPAGPFGFEKSETRQILESTQLVDVDGGTDELGFNSVLHFDSGKKALLSTDDEGRKQWTTRFTKFDRANQYRPVTYGYRHGHLLAVAIAGRFEVLDLLATAREPKVIWGQALSEPPPDAVMNFSRPLHIPNGVAGPRNTQSFDGYGRPLGQLGPVTHDLLYYQSDTSLYAADPLSGEVQWVRQNLPRGCELSGDADYLLAIPPGSREALVFRAGDGEKLDARPIPPEYERLQLRGRRLLRWTGARDSFALSLQDVVSGETLWSHNFSDQAQPSLVSLEEVAVLEPAGRIAVLGIDDGSTRLDAAVDPVSGLQSFVLLHTRERDVLLTYCRDPNAPLRVEFDTGDTQSVNGIAYGFDRKTGERVWSRQIDEQSIDLSQPLELPILTFVSHLTVPRTRTDGYAPSSILVLDKRTGDVIFNDQAATSQLRFRVTAAANRSRIDLHFAMFRLGLTQKTPEPDATGKQ